MGRLARFIRFFTEEDEGHGGEGGEFVTVRGISPLTLINALAGKMKSLIQFGKVSESGGVITCNNGELVKEHQSGLPRGYTLLDCVGGGGSQYIVTDVYLSSSDVVECEYRNSSTTGYGAIYGIYKSGESSALYGNQTYYGYDAGNNKVDTRVAVDTDWHASRHDFVNGTLTVDDVTVTFTPWEFTNTTKNAVLTRYYNGSYGYHWKGYIRKFKVTRGNAVICDLLPCKNEQDEAGMYDLISQTFYGATGGTLLEGNEVDDYVLATDGTPETVTVGEQTITGIPNLYAVGDVADEYDLVSGKITHRTEAFLQNGAVVIIVLAEPVEEQGTAHTINLVEGTNTVSWIAEVSGKEMEAEYMYKEEEQAIVGSAIVGTAKI